MGSSAPLTVVVATWHGQTCLTRTLACVPPDPRVNLAIVVDSESDELDHRTRCTRVECRCIDLLTDGGGLVLEDDVLLSRGWLDRLLPLWREDRPDPSILSLYVPGHVRHHPDDRRHIAEASGRRGEMVYPAARFTCTQAVMYTPLAATRAAAWLRAHAWDNGLFTIDEALREWMLAEDVPVFCLDRDLAQHIAHPLVLAGSIQHASVTWQETTGE